MTEKHIDDFHLEFKFSKLSMARKPLLLIIAFFTFFALAIIYVRLDFAITKDEGTEIRLKVAGYCEKVVRHQEKRLSNYSIFDDAFAKFKTSKDAETFQATFKKITADQITDTAAIADLKNLLKAIRPDVSEKISELQNLHRSYRIHQISHITVLDQWVTGKLGKQKFIDQEATIIKEKGECSDKINTILCYLRSL